jgi:hypothetical protein
MRQWIAKVMTYVSQDDVWTLKKTTIEGTAGMTVAALTLQDWVAVLTGLYILLQIGLLLPKYSKLLKELIKNWRNPQAK